MYEMEEKILEVVSGTSLSFQRDTRVSAKSLSIAYTVSLLIHIKRIIFCSCKGEDEHEGVSGSIV